MRSIGYLVLSLIAGSVLGYGDPPNFVKQVTAVRTNDPIQIDGVLSESVWHRPGMTDFFQQEPDQGKPVSELTEVWVAYDDAALYIAARMHDAHPDSIIARLARRDNDVGSDVFAVGIDSYNDKRNGFYFIVSAAGTLQDGIMYNDDWTDGTWDGVWEAIPRITSDGWCVEMKIPFSQLRFEEKNNYVWGIDFERIIGRKKEQAFLTYTPRNESGFVSRFPELVGIEHITPPTRFEATPYITEKAEYLKHDVGDPFNTGSKYTPDFGADFKWGIGNNLVVEGTINPDFGQVEVDPAVVNLSDVETYYDEKRPFFMEGMNIFSFGNGGVNNYWSFNWSSPSMFYSRRIGRAPQGSLPDHQFADIPSGTRILGAAKITGKVGDGWNIGAIEALTKREFAQLEDGAGIRSEAEVEPTTWYGIERIQHDFNDGKQGLGMLLTSAYRFFDNPQMKTDFNENSFVGGIDGWTTLDDAKEYMISGWTTASFVQGTRQRILDLQQSSAHYFQRPDASEVTLDSSATSLSGFAGRLNLNKQKGRMMLNAALGVISPGFESSDLGFLSRADVINYHVATGYKWNDPTAYYRYINVYASYFNTLNFGGYSTVRGLWTGVDYQFTNYHTFMVRYDYIFRGVSDRRTRGGPLTDYLPGFEWMVDYSTDGRDNYSWELYWYAYERGDGFNHNLNLYCTLRPSSNLSISIGPGYAFNLNKAQWVDNVTDSYATATYGKRYIFADLDYKELSAQIRLNWIFTPTLSLQLFIQPLISSGRYTNFKELARPSSFDFLVYGQNNSQFFDSTSQNGNLYFDPDGSGPAPRIQESNPNFNTVSLRGNAVLRWEYMPGSTLYLVWTQSRSDNLMDGSFNMGGSFDRLGNSTPDNIFMLKLTYWLGR